MPRPRRNSIAKSEQRFRLLVDAVHDYAIYMLDPTGHITTWNSGAQRNKGYSASEIIGSHFRRFFLPEDAASKVPESILHRACTDGHVQDEGWRVRKNGTTFWASIVVTPIHDSTGDLIGFAKVTRDLTERKRHEEALRSSERALQSERDRLQTTLSSIADGVITTDADGRIDFMNLIAERLTGCTLAHAHGKPIEDIFHLVEQASTRPLPIPIHKCLEDHASVTLQHSVSLLDAQGALYHIHISAAPILTQQDVSIGSVLVFQDITHLRNIQQDMEFNALHDSLTLLPNRRCFLERLDAAIRNASKEHTHHALVFLDLDRFKIVNDTAGHTAGDSLLCNVSRLLLESVRHTDTVARLGGDEFALILMDCSPASAEETLSNLLRRIAALRFTWEGRVFSIGASIGVALLDSSTEAGTALKQADVACYAAKNAGRNRIRIYQQNSGEEHEQHRQLHLAAEIREALTEGRFCLFAQPIVAASQPIHTRFEVLLRMMGNDGKLISPATFIPAAERYDLMASLDRWVIERLLLHLGPSLVAIPDRQIFINLSANSLNQAGFHAFLLGVLERSCLPSSSLVFEITETALINNIAATSQLIDSLRSTGCKIALDDFGSGLCSFHYLRNFKVDYIKIDGSFIRTMRTNPVDLTIVKAINQIAHDIHCTTIAEFVEDLDIFTSVIDLGIDLAQGYGLGMPGPIEAILPQNQTHHPNPLHPSS